jgi:hypothetical protein
MGEITTAWTMELTSRARIALLRMNHATLVKCAFASALLFLAGCQTRSISNSGFKDNHRHSSQLGGYTGELSELDVIGLTPDTTVTEADIQAAVAGPAGTKLQRTSKVLLIQSGADIPDAPMLDAMRARYAVAAFSGRPETKAAAGTAFAKTLRLIAARGGYDKIVCYWGVLESQRKDKITSTISWVPIVGYVIPDEREHMRINLKAVIVDVATGRWTFVTPPPAESSSLSTVLSREEIDQDLVQKLKAEGYQSLARTLAENHTE